MKTKHGKKPNDTFMFQKPLREANKIQQTAILIYNKADIDIEKLI